MIKTLQNTLKQDKERFTVPRSVQDIIPIRRIWPDGVFQFGSKYSKTLRFSDINYAIASKEDILQSKGHRDRRLFLSDELISYLIEYDCAIRNCFPKREYFFPGPSGNIISASSIPFNFRKIWLAAGLKRDGEIKPRPYDFRHHFACANIARWAKERKDVISMLPYLMRYMGHSSLEKTYYYVHLIPDYFADYAAATENLESLLPEVEPYEI